MRMMLMMMKKKSAICNKKGGIGGLLVNFKKESFNEALAFEMM